MVVSWWMVAFLPSVCHHSMSKLWTYIPTTLALTGLGCVLQVKRIVKKNYVGDVLLHLFRRCLAGTNVKVAKCID